MSKYRRHNWQKLFAEFEQSGLSQIEFCKQRDINPKYFSLKLSQHQFHKTRAFTQVDIKPDISLSQGLILEVGNCKIHCPVTMPIPSFISLVKSLA